MMHLTCEASDLSSTNGFMRYQCLLVLLLFAASGVPTLYAQAQTLSAAADPGSAKLAEDIRADQSLDQVHKLAQDLLKTGLNAGSGYSEVWIRDLNTFIEIALEVNPPARLKEALVNFLKFQGPTGDIVDGYVRVDAATVKYAYRMSPLAPELMAHKNTVETDQESSLIQAITKYVEITGDRTILDERVDGMTVRERLGHALE